MTDKDEFCKLIRKNENSMYHFAFSVVKNDADASEVISESIFRAYKNYGSLKNTASFKPWILRIVHNTAVEMIRKNSKIITADYIDETADSGIENDIIKKYSLRSAVNALKQPYRTVITLYYFEDLSTAKISQITDTDVATVKKQLSRAREILRNILKEDFER